MAGEILTDVYDTSITDIDQGGNALTQLLIGDKIFKADISERITEKDPQRAPFIRFLELLGNKEVTDHWKYECLEEDRKATKGTLDDTGSATVVGSNTETRLRLNEANLFVAGDVLEIIDITAPGSSERVRVTSKTDAYEYQVKRAYSDSSAKNDFTVDVDEVIKIGSVYSENSKSADPDKHEPSWNYNICQTFKESVELSGRVMAMKGRGQYNEIQKQLKIRFRHFNEAMEAGFLFGGREYNEQGTYTGRTTTGGLNWCIDSWADSGNIKSAAAEVFNQQYLDNLGNDIFRYGSDKKLSLVSGKTLSKIGDFGTTHLRINENATKKLGVAVTDLTTVHGILSFVHSRTLEQSVVWEKYMFVIDPAYVKKRFMPGRDVHIRTNVQDNDLDGKKHSIEGDVGFDLRLPDSHFVITNISNSIV